MKKLFIAATLAAALTLSCAVHAQQYSVVPLVTLLTVPASGTSNYTAVVNCRAANTVGITTYSALSGSGTEGMVWSFSKSADGSVFETTPSVTITNTSNGTTPVKKFTVVDVTGVHTLKLVSVVNGNSSYVLTNSVTAGVKNFVR